MCYEAVHQSCLLCFLRRNHGPRKNQLARPGSTNEPWNQPAASPIGMQANQSKTWSECRLIGGDSDIAAEGEAESCTRTGPIHCRDHRLRQRSHAPRDHLSLGKDSTKVCFVLTLTQLLKLVNIASGRK